MKTKILSLAVALVAAISTPSFAQQQGKSCVNKDCKNEKCKTEQVCKSKDCKGNHYASLFESMNLTDAQKAQLKELREKQKAQRVEAEKANRQQRRENARAAKRQYLNDVKNIIGEDNYVIFLENMVLNQPQQPPFAKGKMAQHFGQKQKGDCKFKNKDKAKDSE